jgi:hypothetical protein
VSTTAGSRGTRKKDDLRLLLRLLWQEDGLDVGQDAALGDGDAGQQLVQLLVVPDGQLQMTGDDTSLLVVTGGVACQLEDFGGQVLHDGGQVDGSAGSDALGVVALAKETMDSAHGELEPSAAGAGLALSLDLATLSTSRHLGGGFLRLLSTTAKL